ncbi:hypothetical protein Nwi_0380 [Nitrobacter winogradskyi Nb-255]|uniref:Uncharacterized protein n=1 Tax=Nitrobacter winogradskyi (strain ATCC 25391 / DSM 10237 / CIP 104748 / NCIMB 11846 / Nb-255) TaxID=323098 RepID=Q3SVP4_NITWN|nr:hypothetical protein Nwi_0380 [Nitrobacter winogradskyi Nb-255]
MLDGKKLADDNASSMKREKRGRTGEKARIHNGADAGRQPGFRSCRGRPNDPVNVVRDQRAVSAIPQPSRPWCIRATCPYLRFDAISPLIAVAAFIRVEDVRDRDH